MHELRGTSSPREKSEKKPLLICAGLLSMQSGKKPIAYSHIPFGSRVELSSAKRRQD